MLRANAAVSGLSDRTHVHLGDYRALDLPRADGPTLFVGNPPYVRHHRIAPEWKTWLAPSWFGRQFPGGAPRSLLPRHRRVRAPRRLRRVHHLFGVDGCQLRQACAPIAARRPGWAVAPRPGPRLRALLRRDGDGHDHLLPHRGGVSLHEDPAGRVGLRPRPSEEGAQHLQAAIVGDEPMVRAHARHPEAARGVCRTGRVVPRPPRDGHGGQRGMGQARQEPRPSGAGALPEHHQGP